MLLKCYLINTRQTNWGN